MFNVRHPGNKGVFKRISEFKGYLVRMGELAVSFLPSIALLILAVNM